MVNSSASRSRVMADGDWDDTTAREHIFVSCCLELNSEKRDSECSGFDLGACVFVKLNFQQYHKNEW